MLTALVIVYLLFTIAVGFYSARRIKRTEDFTLAGKSLSAVVVGITIFATWFGPELIMGVPTLFIEEGVQGIITDQFGNFLCLVLIGTFYARQLYRLNITTINDFFKLRYSHGLETFTALLNVFAYFSWIAAQFLALSFLFNLLFGTSTLVGIMLSAVIVLTYTYVGGMWAVSITDVFQSVIIVIGLVVLGDVLLEEAGGFKTVAFNVPDGFYNILPENDFYSWTDYITKWMYLGVGALPSQEIFQRILSARSSRSARQGTYISAGLLFVVGSIPLFIGLAASQLHPDLMDINDGQSIIPTLVNKYMSEPIKILFFGALISAILSTSSGAMLSPATVISENIIRPNLKSMNDKRLLYYTRLSVVLVAFISCIWASFNTSIHGLVVTSILTPFVCMVVPFTLGLYWKRISVIGVWWGMITGLITWGIATVLSSKIEPMLLGFLVNLVVTVIVSLLKPDDSYT
ncbi:MAG: sodium:solute symporter family protein, partial [Flavobacteriaceae bacterium]